jgi:hypothetical protein
MVKAKQTLRNYEWGSASDPTETLTYCFKIRKKAFFYRRECGMKTSSCSGVWQPSFFEVYGKLPWKSAGSLDYRHGKV